MQLTAKLSPASCRGILTQKLFRVMKITAIFLLAASLHLSAKTLGQQVTLSVKDATLKTVFLELNRQTGFNFLYSDETLAKASPVTINVKDASLEDVLTLCFYGQPLSYSVENNSIVVKPKVKVITPSSSGGGQGEVPPIDIHGRVVNEKGEPVAGASIKIKGTEIGTSTNDNGEFTLNAPLSNIILVISSVNIETVEVRLNGRTNLTITVKTLIKLLDEIIAKGYYNTTKKLNTGTVSKVTAEEIGKQPVSNPLAALQGRVSGLFITQGTGLPGSNFSVLIRGKNSIQNGNSPLYMIDGVPFLSDADRLTQINSINSNSPFNTINPDDIESIEVLKDADATAIYGSRGANGVILITTKKGKPGKTNLEISSYAGWGRVTQTLDFMNTQQYLQMRREALSNDGVIPTQSNGYDLLVWDTTRYTNWKKLLIGSTSHTNKIQLRLSGGNENNNFSLGSNYYKETTVFPSSDLFDKRLSSSLSVNHKSANNKFNSATTVSYTSEDNKMPQQDLTNSIKLSPNAPRIYDSLGKLNFREGGFSFSNPYAVLLKTYETVTNRLNANANLSYKILPQLIAKMSFGYTTVSSDETTLIPIASKDPATSPTGNTQIGKNSYKSWIIEPQLEYSTPIGKGKLQALIGGTLQENKNESSLTLAFGITNDALLLNLGSLPQSNVIFSNAYSQYRYVGVYGRLNYNLEDKYIVNLTGRRDGSSRFGPSKQFANFGAVGIGWIFSREKFIQNTLPFLSFGKLRGSYGLTGNDKIGDYLYLDTWTAGSAYQNLTALRPTRLFNSDYAWEAIQKMEVAIDLGFLHDRILLAVNWFRNKSDNQLLRYNLPAQTGFPNIFRNFPGVVENKGIEFELNSVNFKNKSFEWKTSFNFTKAQNKLLAFPGLESSSYATSYLVGQSLNVFLGYHFVGVDPQTGVYKFEDINRDGNITPRGATSMNDYIIVGTTDPKYYGGIQNSLKYKGWQLDFLFQYVKQLGREPVYTNTNPPGGAENVPIALLNRWQKPGDIAPYQRLTQTGSPAYFALQSAAKSSAALIDASYIRLKNLSVSYSLPNIVLQRFKVDNFKFFIEGQNLLTISKYYKGLDPENQSFALLPPLRMLTTGIQITF